MRDDELQAIRERDAKEYVGAAFPTKAILDRHALLAEVDRLAADKARLMQAIEQHQDDIWSEEWVGNPADERLWAVLEAMKEA